MGRSQLKCQSVVRGLHTIAGNDDDDDERRMGKWRKRERMTGQDCFDDDDGDCGGAAPLSTGGDACGGAWAVVVERG